MAAIAPSPGRARGGIAAGYLARKLARWSEDAFSALATDPDLPEAMSDREGDISVPLLAIADHAGPEWAARGRKALLEVFGLRTVAEGNTEIEALLLTDIRTEFGAKAATSDGVLLHQNSLKPAENLGCCGVAAVGAPLWHDAGTGGAEPVVEGEVEGEL